MTIQYKYAIDSYNEICDIDNIFFKNDKTNQYHCIGCGDLMIPKIGKGIRKKHFAQKINTTCSTETYLHSLAKKMFKDEFQKCIKNKMSFEIHIMQKNECDLCEKRCFSESKSQRYNLVKYYDKIETEQFDGEFRPDVSLTNTKNNDKIYIEFKVSHASEEKKINSNIKIIEIELIDEFDLNFIKKHYITCEYPFISFYNFKNLKAQECFNKKKELVFIHYPTNNSFYGEKPIEEILELKNIYGPNTYIIKYDEKYRKYSNNSMYLFSYKKLYNDKKIQTCGSCKYLSTNSELYLNHCNIKSYCLKNNKKIQHYKEGITCLQFSTCFKTMSNNFHIHN